jgi:ATP-dependent RNA helicase DDX52/ROK1
MFSATFSDELAAWFKMNLDNVVSLIVGGKNCATESVDQRLQFVGNEAGKEIALKNLILKGMDVPVVIFVDHIKTAKTVFKHLITCNINAECIHSDRPQVEREKVMRQFREGKIMFLVATELLGRGIDFRAVNTVINYDCPKSATAYIHRIGRTGRAGRSGLAITFYKENDIPRLRAILSVMKRSKYEIPDFLERCITSTKRPAKRKKISE